MAGKFEESMSALRTYAITLRRDADALDKAAREMAVHVVEQITAAQAKRAEAAQHDAAADALHAGQVSIRIESDLSDIAARVRKEVQATRPVVSRRSRDLVG